MMPKLPPPPSILMPFQIDAVDRWAKDYARAVAEECAAKCEAIAESYSRNGIADQAISECAAAIRKAADELGK